MRSAKPQEARVCTLQRYMRAQDARDSSGQLRRVIDLADGSLDDGLILVVERTRHAVQRGKRENPRQESSAVGMGMTAARIIHATGLLIRNG